MDRRCYNSWRKVRWQNCILSTNLKYSFSARVEKFGACQDSENVKLYTSQFPTMPTLNSTRYKNELKIYFIFDPIWYFPTSPNNQPPPQHRCFLCWLVKSWGPSSQSSGTYCQAFVFYVSHEQWMCRITISISPFTCTKLPRYFVLPPTSPFQDDPWPCRLSSTSFVRSKDYSCTENITIPSLQKYHKSIHVHTQDHHSKLPTSSRWFPARHCLHPARRRPHRPGDDHVDKDDGEGDNIKISKIRNLWKAPDWGCTQVAALPVEACHRLTIRAGNKNAFFRRVKWGEKFALFFNPTLMMVNVERLFSAFCK